MSKYEDAWNALKIALISTEQELKEAAVKNSDQVENLPTQMRMLYKMMYLISLCWAVVLPQFEVVN